MADLPFEIDIETDEDSVEGMDVSLMPTEDGGMDVIFQEKDEDQEVPDNFLEHDANIAEFLDEETLQKIANKLDTRFQEDLSSNLEFFDNINRGLRQLGLTLEELDDPFPGASPVTHPLVLEAALKTQSKIMGEIFNGKGLVDTYLAQEHNPDSQYKANRVKNYMDYQYMHQMGEFIPESEKLSFRYALTGNAYRKYYFDPIENRPRTRFITEDKFIINTNCATIKDADFHTELYTLDKHELEHYIELGHFRNFKEDSYEVMPEGSAQITEVDGQIAIETGAPMGFTNGTFSLDKYQLREYHCYLSLESPYNEGVSRALPYIVTAEAGTGKLLAIRRNWKNTDGLKLKRSWYSHYCLIPGLGFHGMGYLHILGNFQFSLTQITRSLLDSGQFSNLQAGFRAKGVRFTRDANVPLRLGEFREIDTGGKDIKDVIFPLNFKEPSQTLQAILLWLDGRAQKFADSTEQVIADSTNYGPVGTTVALLEASTKFTNGILKRFYKALNEEFKILYDLNFDVLDETSDFYLKGQKFTVSKDDFGGGIDVLPSADPNLSSSAHRIAVAQTKLTAAQQAPEIHNVREAYKEFYRQLGMEQEEIDRLLPPEEEAQPLDPLSDIIAASQGKPIKAFPGQDHDAHIKFKTSFLQDPLGGAQEIAQGVVPIIQANIAEHALLKYVERMQGVMSQMNPQTIEQIGMEKAQAEAAEIVRAVSNVENINELAEAGDPATILALAEKKNADIREMESRHKMEADLVKHMIANRELELKEMEIALKAKSEAEKTEMEMAKERLRQGSSMIKQALGELADRSNVVGVDKPTEK